MKKHGRKSTRYSIWINLKNIKLSCRRMLCKILKSTKTYILQTFMYREYAENFSKKIKSAIKALDPFAEGYEKTGYNIED